jgi:hypothetical protein
MEITWGQCPYVPKENGGLEGGEVKKVKNVFSISGNFKHSLFPKINPKPQILFFCDFKPHAKFWNPTITPSWRKVTGSEKKKKRKRHYRDEGLQFSNWFLTSI